MSRSYSQNQFNMEGFCGFGFIIHPLDAPHPPLFSTLTWFGPQLFLPESVPFFGLMPFSPPSSCQYSLCNESLIELTNPGASGSIFYVTRDDEFIIKTVQHKEAEFLQKLLPGYYMVSPTGGSPHEPNPFLRFESQQELARWLTRRVLATCSCYGGSGRRFGALFIPLILPCWGCQRQQLRHQVTL